MAGRRDGDIFLELFAKYRQDLHAGVGGIATVWTHHQSAPTVTRDAAFDHLLQAGPPVVPTRFEDVKGITHAGHEARRILRQHVLHRIHLTFHSPRSDGGVLRGGNRVAGRFSGAIVPPGAKEGSHGVRAEEVHQVRGSAQGCGLHRGDPAETEVVELENLETKDQNRSCSSYLASSP